MNDANKRMLPAISWNQHLFILLLISEQKYLELD